MTNPSPPDGASDRARQSEFDPDAFIKLLRESAETPAVNRPASAPPTEANPYNTLRHELRKMYTLVVRARVGENVRHYINSSTELWDGAATLARKRSAAWGIPFETFFPILTEANQTREKLFHVALGDTSIPFPPLLFADYLRLEEYLRNLADMVPADLPAPADQNETSPPPATETQKSEGGTPGNPRVRRVPSAEAEILVREWLAENAKGNPASIKRDDVAAKTGVSTGSVSETLAWKAFAKHRKEETKPKVREVPLTHKLLAVLPSDCDTQDDLAALI